MLIPSSDTSFAVRFLSVHITVLSRICKLLKHPLPVTTARSVACHSDIFVLEVCHQGDTRQHAVVDRVTAELTSIGQTETINSTAMGTISASKLTCFLMLHLVCYRV